MSEIITFPLPGGPNFTIPDVGDENWGQSVTDYLVAIPLGVPPTSGTFTLTGDLYFGASFGLVSQYYKSPTINPASAGIVRLAKTDLIDWRNNANSGNNSLAVNSSDQLTFNGVVLTTGASSNLTDVGTDGITITGGTGAVLGSGTTISQHVADATHNGYLSSADWNTFNSASGTVTSVAMTVPAFLSVSGSPITSSGTLAVSLSGTALPVANGGTAVTSLGNFTDVGTDGIIVTGGTGGVIHSISIAQTKSDATHNGYLSSTDWSTFNSAAGGGITSLTGDVTGTGPGATATTLATVNSNVGSFTNANITVNAKGLITAASNGTGINSGTANHLAYYSGTNTIDSSVFLINNSTGDMVVSGLLTVGTGGVKYTSASNSSIIKSASIATSDRTWTIPDIAANATFASLEGTQTFTGTKTLTTPTLSGTVTLSSATANRLVSTDPFKGLDTSSTIGISSNKLTGLANGTASTDAAAFGQIFTGFQAVVQSTTATNTATTSSTFANTALAATITPTSSSHRVLITVSGTAFSNVATHSCFVTIARGSTNLAGASGFSQTRAGAGNAYSAVGITFIDSPATTSATTYTVQIKNDDNATDVEWQPTNNLTSVITLTEIV